MGVWFHVTSQDISCFFFLSFCLSFPPSLSLTNTKRPQKEAALWVPSLQPEEVCEAGSSRGHGPAAGTDPRAVTRRTDMAAAPLLRLLLHFLHISHTFTTCIPHHHTVYIYLYIQYKCQAPAHTPPSPTAVLIVSLHVNMQSLSVFIFVHAFYLVFVH